MDVPRAKDSISAYISGVTHTTYQSYTLVVLYVSFKRGVFVIGSSTLNFISQDAKNEPFFSLVHN